MVKRNVYYKSTCKEKGNEMLKTNTTQLHKMAPKYVQISTLCSTEKYMKEKEHIYFLCVLRIKDTNKNIQFVKQEHKKL
jgi:hypothetical protein